MGPYWVRLYSPLKEAWGFPCGTEVKNSPAVQETQETWVRAMGWGDPPEKEMQPTPVFLPGRSYEQRILAGYSLRGCRVGHNWAMKEQQQWTLRNNCFLRQCYVCLTWASNHLYWFWMNYLLSSYTYTKLISH